MDSFIFLIAQFLMPHAMGLDVLPFDGDPKTYSFTHPVGVFLIRLEGGRLFINLPFHAFGNRVAAVYLHFIQEALEQGIPTADGGRLTFTLEKNVHLGTRLEDRTDFHGSIFQMQQVAKSAETPAPAPEAT